MHAQDGNTRVYGDDVPVCHVGSHGTAAALIDLAQSGDLPLDTGGVQGGTDMLHSLGGGIGSAALAPGAGVLADGNAVVQHAVVPAIAGLGEVGVKGIGNVGRQAEGIGKAMAQLYILAVTQNLHEVLKGMALHTADAHGADFFLVGQNAHGGVLGGRQGQHGLQLGIGADPVVMAVGTQQAPVQAHFPALAGRNHRQLGGAEIVFHNAVLLVQQPHDVQLHQVAALALQRLGTQDHIQLLTGNALGQGLLHLVSGQVDQQIGDHQNGIVLVLADGDGDLAAVLLADHTVDGQGHAGPLVLLDAAIVVGLEVGDFGILIHGLGLQIHPGGIHVGSADVGTLSQALGTHHGDHKALATVVHVNLVAGLDLHTGDSRLEAVLLGLSGSPRGGFPLGLAGIHKSSVALAIGFHFGTVLIRQTCVAVLGAAQQRFAEFIYVHLSFLHNMRFCQCISLNNSLPILYTDFAKKQGTSL